MTKINQGRAFFTAPDQLGQYLLVLVDYLSRKERKMHLSKDVMVNLSSKM